MYKQKIIDGKLKVPSRAARSRRDEGRASARPLESSGLDRARWTTRPSSRCAGSRSGSRASSPTTTSTSTSARRGARAARRERRRQVDPDEHPLRALPARRGRDPGPRQAGHVPSAKDAIDARDRDGAPALHAHPGDDRRGEHRPRQRADARQASCSTSEAAEERVARPLAARSSLAVDPTRASCRTSASASSSASRS